MVVSEEQLLDVFRNACIVFWLCSLVPSGIFAAAATASTNFGVNKMDVEVRAFRLQQFETSGKVYGSKSWKVLYEAVSINESALRKCVVLNWRDLIDISDFDEKFAPVIGAVLVILPRDVNNLSEADYEAFLSIEQKFAALKTELSVYFAQNSEELQSLIRGVTLTSNRATTATQQLLNSIVADTYQITSSNSASTNLASAKVYNVIGHLNAQERGLPYLFIVANYDTYGIVPALNFGSDSNGSGVSVLLELLAIFRQIYALPSHLARYNLVFVLSAAGRFSYQGSRSFIDDFNERHSDGKIVLTVCLDSLAKGGDSLFVHASKMPSATSNANKLITHLRNFASVNRTVSLVTKKINLGAERLAWEHEIYNIRRIHAMTISHFEHFNDSNRNSILDTPKRVDFNVLEANTRTIANALIAFVFQLDSQQCESAKQSNIECSLLLNEAFSVDKRRLAAWMKLFGSTARPVAVPQQQLVANLHQVVKRYAHSAHVTEVAINDFILYEIIEDTLSANVVKPAIFELILASGICAYLYVIYFLAINAQQLLEGSISKIKKLVVA